jgi:hypothetical protein
LKIAPKKIGLSATTGENLERILTDGVRVSAAILVKFKTEKDG